MALVYIKGPQGGFGDKCWPMEELTAYLGTRGWCSAIQAHDLDADRALSLIFSSLIADLIEKRGERPAMEMIAAFVAQCPGQPPSADKLN